MLLRVHGQNVTAGRVKRGFLQAGETAPPCTYSIALLCPRESNTFLHPPLYLMPPYIAGSALSKERARRPQTGGLGAQFSSPKRARKTNGQKKKVQSYYHDQRLQKLRDKLASLQEPPAPSALLPSDPIVVDEDDPHVETESEVWVDDDGAEEFSEVQQYDPSTDSPMADVADLELPTRTAPPKRLTPDEAAKELYGRWKVLVPSLAPSLLKYLDSTTGKEWTPPPTSLKSECSQGAECPTGTCTVTVLLFASKSLICNETLQGTDVVFKAFCSAVCSSVDVNLHATSLFATVYSQQPPLIHARLYRSNYWIYFLL